MKREQGSAFADGEFMRRSQTTILTTLAVIASLLFMSQFPAISSVSNIHPDDTDGTPPPNTDTDGDLIPDVHETLFEQWTNWTAVDGRDVVMQGLDKNNASDASTDRDRDGLNATEEFCWPYPANCTDPGFPRGLTGQLDENSNRIYLDPRVSDTDGDGMPDGYEAYMCQRMGGFDPVALRFSCPSFDPLNASDLTLDSDNDGFDVDRDGIMSDAERYTAPEEYAYGTPMNFTAELDGLWCHATLPEGSVLKSWPYLPSGANATFHNLLEACTNRAVNTVGEDLWLGTDPLLDDSDRYLWDGFSIRSLYPSFGDGIPDGWEVHFGLNPLNRSNALDDPDRDGWDANRDGGVSDDVSRTLTALKVGEALSTLEEYLVYYDEGNTVYPGLKSTTVGNSDEFTTVPLIYDTPQDVMSIMHHDVRALEEHDGTLYAMTKYGVSVLGLDDNTQSHHMLPQGVLLHDGFLATSDGSPYAAVLGTSIGFAVVPLLADGALGSIGTWDWSLTGPLHAVAPLAGEDVNLHAIGLGQAGEGSIVEIDGSASIVSAFELGTGLVAGLAEANASVSSIQHGLVSGTTFNLFVGTDRGLFILETSSARDDEGGEWRFFYTPESTPIQTNVDEVRSLPLGATGNPAEIRDMVLDGPSPSNAQALWFGTPSGLHKLDLNDDFIEHGGLMVHPGVEGKLSRETNSIHSIHPTGDELLVGSEWGLWALAGDYTAVYGLQDQTRLPG
ncbi:MAG TPA: hypothetical protein HA353_02155, partial [Candidatus Poseidonia sp.]|nr:hypothetical protein [Poseidonia sp.]